jgi:ribosomal protein S18 acetylase RimI-like enzyme
VRIDGDEHQNLHLLEERGFRLIDCSVKLGAPVSPQPPAAPPGVQIRPYEEADREEVLRISVSSHSRNHFYNDEALDRRATDALFRAWVERCLDRLAAYVFVAAGARNEALGFVTYLVNRPLNEKLGLRLVALDYIVLDSAFQGAGIGMALMGQSLAALSDRFDQVELRASQNNYPALACYAKYGFRTLSSDFLLHRRGA